MKLLYFDDFKLGVLKGDTVVDVPPSVQDIPHTGPHDLINGLIEHFADYRKRLEKAVADGQGHAARRSVRIRPPLPKPGNIDCMAVNYMEDGTLREAGADQRLPQGAEHGHRQRRHDGAAGRAGDDLRGRSRDRGRHRQARAKNVSADDAMEYVFGYINFIDGSARGLPPSNNTFFQMKSRDTFAPIGPYLVTADEIADPQKLQIRLWNNGDAEAELQHRRHGAQDPALHRVGVFDPYAGAGRHPRHRHQPPRPQPLHGRRQDRDGGARASAGCTFNISDDLKRTWARTPASSITRRAPKAATRRN